MVKFLQNKKVRRIGAVVLGAATVTAAVLGIGFGTGLFNKSASIESSGSGLTIGNISNNGISLTATQLEVPAGATYESAYSITATITPADATDKGITLSVAFEDDTDSWVTANTASVSDYVTLSADSITSGGAVTLYCYQAFGEQVVITATSDGVNEDLEQVSATCTLEYCSRLTDVAITVASDALGTAAFTGDGTSATLNAMSSDYTEYSDVVTYSVTYTYGTGTMKEDYSTVVAVDSTTITSGTTTASELVEVLTGTAITSNTDLATAQSALQTKYDAGTAAGTITVTSTGSTTGTEFSFTYSLFVDASGAYVPVTGITFDTEKIIL